MKHHTFSCVIIDDEDHAISAMQGHIRKVPELDLIGSYKDPILAFREITSGIYPNIIFLDVDMPGLTGIELAKMLPKSVIIIFVTAHEQHALQAFEIDVFDYLLKPFSFSKFLKCITKIKERFLGNEPQRKLLDDTIFISNGLKGTVVQLDVSQIIYIEAFDHTINIFTTDNTVNSRVSLKAIEESLLENRFARIHRAYIINIGYVKSLNAKGVTMSNGYFIPLGDMYKNALMEKIRKKFVNGS